jgi:hypothetical protein
MSDPCNKKKTSEALASTSEEYISSKFEATDGVRADSLCLSSVAVCPWPDDVSLDSISEPTMIFTVEWLCSPDVDGRSEVRDGCEIRYN